MKRPLLVVASCAIGLAILVTLAIANAAGYRYGVSDQAFYLPSILHAVDPVLYPRDGALLDAQGHLMVSDELTAWAMTQTGIPVEVLFLTGHVASLALLFAAVWLIARGMASHRWTVAACCVAATLRHRITETGANTFEGYYHPRGLAFACGAAAAAAMARDRLGLAWGLALAAVILHPTTGLWWAVWLAAATLVMATRHRVLVAACAVAAALGGAALLFFTSLGSRLQVMDAAWVRPFASKDYVFPNEWPPEAWLANLVLPVVVVGIWRWRRRRGLAARWEAAMAAGVVALTATFLASLPFVASHIALAVQLQTSRVFWVIDLFAVVSLTWLLAEGRRHVDVSKAVAPAPSWRPAGVALVLLIAAAARGVYIMRVEHPERPFVQMRLEDNNWVRVGDWVADHTPVDTHVLADPEHDWKYGHSVRLTAQRDVLVESVKDAALSLYDRNVATRVQSRIEAIGDFSALDARSARALAQRYDLDVLVIDRDLPLRELHRDGRFRVYDLKP